MPRSVLDRESDPNLWDDPQGSVNCWAWCLGMFHDDPNVVPPSAGAHYSFNVGASYATSGTSTMTYMYGHDPTVIVKGGGHKP